MSALAPMVEKHVRRIGRLAVALVVPAAAFVPAPVAAVSSQTGVVTWISDGDTFTIDLNGGPEIRVRLTGINAAETGRCHAQDAEDRLSDLVLGRTVTLTAKDLGAKTGDRYWRWVSVGGTDVGLKLLQEGLVLPFPHNSETTKNNAYMKAGAAAAAAHIGMWDSDACGSGPYQSNTLRLWVNWDADGTDSKNLNGEYVRIKNDGPSTIPLRGWYLRDAGTDHYYFFPRGTEIAPGRYLTVHVGDGTNTSRHLYADWGRAIFLNANASKTLGDGAYLFDPDDDLRAHMTYPCVRSCTSSLIGKIKLRVREDAPGADSENPNGEYVKVVNVSSSTINLRGYLLESYPYIHDFYSYGDSAKVKPGEYLRVRIGKGENTSRTRYWGKSKGILNNGGDVVLVRTFDGIVVRCSDWGSASC